MTKLASITITVLVVSWLRACLEPVFAPSNVLIAGSMLWVAVFGTYFVWLLLLVMVRQLGAAVRGK